MHRFFLKAALFIAGLIVVFNFLGSVAQTIAPLDDWRNEQHQRAAGLLENKEHIQAVTLGNSHSDSIDYSVLGLEGQSLAFPSADLFEVERYAAYLANELPDLKIVFIGISYYSFSWDNATLEPFRTRRMGFYSIIPTWYPIQGDLSLFVFGKLDAATHIMSVIRSDSWRGVWAGLASEGPTADPFPYDGVHTESAWGECVHYTEEQLEAHAREIAGRNISTARKMSAAHPGLEQDAFDALARTIERLQEKGIGVILLTPAYHQGYTQDFAGQGSDIIREMRRSISNLQQLYPVEYYDFSTDADIAIYPELFYNSDHLGDCGRTVFTQRVLGAMRAHGDFDR